MYSSYFSPDQVAIDKSQPTYNYWAILVLHLCVMDFFCQTDIYGVCIYGMCMFKVQQTGPCICQIVIYGVCIWYGYMPGIAGQPLYMIGKIREDLIWFCFHKPQDLSLIYMVSPINQSIILRYFCCFLVSFVQVQPFAFRHQCSLCAPHPLYWLLWLVILLHCLLALLLFAQPSAPAQSLPIWRCGDSHASSCTWNILISCVAHVQIIFAVHFCVLHLEFDCFNVLHSIYASSLISVYTLGLL